MNIPLLDRSNYLKGLFITAKLDKQLCEKEKDFIKNISDKLGFAQEFYNETIRGLLSNNYLLDDPIKFSDEKIARSFLKDAVKLAMVNEILNDAEINWLKQTASLNNIDVEFIDKSIASYKESPKLLSSKDFALFSII
jgi:hypothetical protein